MRYLGGTEMKVPYSREQIAWIGVRLTLGWMMLWAFLDKLFGLGYATKPAQAWVVGGSPTTGFLTFASTGPFAGFYHAIAGSAVVDVLFMLALLAIGVALILGVGHKLAGYAGALLMLLLWTSALPPANNPIIDEHIVFFFLFVAITVVKAGEWFGLGKWWANMPIVKKYPFLE